MLVGTLGGCGAAQSVHDGGPGSTPVMCNTIMCLLVFTWASQALLEVVAPPFSTPCCCISGEKRDCWDGCRDLNATMSSVALGPGAAFFLLKSLFPPNLLFLRSSEPLNSAGLPAGAHFPASALLRLFHIFAVPWGRALAVLC